MPTCGAYIALFVVAYVRGYNYTDTVIFINKTDSILSLLFTQAWSEPVHVCFML